ncbi:DUF2264 domain-containing protein [Streptomyces litchfieldiae]|uniref:DUF2264 domain-containing protein n=1 Tax=Streptomyces litchfieldiae TaxID=3075543 RepID=A0ABU2MXI6_9ACTN|nr:DUF2264 domain-containing protein [Streptomyces sp. DSM 44938]MDT0346335.1 DUF2264 domain-containing protein [Streptomyces sp. DSM 44938]
MTNPTAPPPEDRTLSPHTGWTRDHWTAYGDRLLAALLPHRSPGGARYALPGPASRNGRDCDELEGFARSFLLAGFRVAGERGAGEPAAALLQRYADGIAAGTDPASPEYWPRPDVAGQAKVEAASIALILQLTRPWLWDHLDDAVRQRTVDWLATVIGQRYPPINWVWFRVVVESFLREAGGPWSPADIEEDLAVHASLRRPGGWLSDGADERAFDHYTGWALHLYPLLWTHLFDVTGTLCPPALRERWAGDLARYLDDAVRLVGADGSPLLQGRSLVYRFAAAAPFWTGALTGTGGLDPGLTRRAVSGIARHFADHGVPGDDGLLTLGWHHAWPGMRQAYSGPSSPYWAAKGMLGLALPADHPVWTAPERALPNETGGVARVAAAPGWLISARPADGITLVLNHGTDHARPGADCADSPLYARLGYSTATVPPLTGGTVADPLDNSVVVLDADGHATHRSGFTTLYAERRPDGVLVAASRGTAHWVDSAGDDSPDHGSGRTGKVTPGPSVTVASVVRDGVEVRLARVDAPAARPEWRAVRLGGWPVTGEAPPERGPGARAESPALCSALRPLRGLPVAGVALERDTSPLGTWTAIPWLATAGPPPLGEVLAAVVTLGRSPEPADAEPELTVGPEAVTVRWPDGTATEVALPAVDSEA